MALLSVSSLLLLPAFVSGRALEVPASPAVSLPCTAPPVALLPYLHIWFTLLRPGPWHVFYPGVCTFLHGTIYCIFFLSQFIIYSSMQFTSSHSGDQWRVLLGKWEGFFPIYFLSVVVLLPVAISGTAVISTLWSRSNELLDILVPLLQTIGIVHSLMCCFSVRSSYEFLPPFCFQSLFSW